ncbi:NAD synthetase / Glutamine amidotransferase chain of NAD synthetase [hydrothermal vent metagenome]|uniref:NAD(+) synthase (glutamine-hydrolyzing) n=1 Tax=hydrothermal vent metagenome TaxID=652676 RepID=A0A3B1BNN8_9ZZZZ
MNSTSHPPSLCIAVAQLNLLVGDIEANATAIIEAALYARDELGAQAVVFPELALCGYPPEDLLLRPGMYERIDAAMLRLQAEIMGIHAIVGFAQKTAAGVYNAAAVICDGEILALARKRYLPNYSVFDEKRYFIAADDSCMFDLQGMPVGVCICEDIWYPEPAARLHAAGAQLILNLNASPFHKDKGPERENIVRQRVSENAIPILYANLVGGQDELVFDGASFVMSATGQISQHLPHFEAGVFPLQFDLEDRKVLPRSAAAALAHETDQNALIYQALVLGVRDFVRKNGFNGVVIGLSGGIDSALTLAIAVDALGPENVEVVMMPSRYTADMSVEDAAEQAHKMKVEYHVLPIEPAFNAFLDILKEEFAGRPVDTTEENIQARCRGVLLMAISNKKGKMLLTTGNKSEMAVGYATLYGDMAGGYDVLKDVPKTRVYQLSRYRNQIAAVIPQRVIERPPSAELAPDQKDSDSLPDYDTLDAILERYVEQDQGLEDIVAAGFDRETVAGVLQRVDRNEYKRRQAAPGIRISPRAFGRDRRYPITSGYGRNRT